MIWFDPVYLLFALPGFILALMLFLGLNFRRNEDMKNEEDR